MESVLTPAGAAAAYRTHGDPGVARAIEEVGAGLVVSGRGATLRTDGGAELIDLASGGFGYGHRRVLRDVSVQMRTMPLSSRVFFSRPLAELLDRIAALTPGDLGVSFFGASESEAVEGALKLAKGFHPDRRRVVSAVGAYHGCTTGALAACGIDRLKARLGSHPLEGVTVPYGDADALERAVDRRAAAILLSPVLVGTEIRIPPPGYLEAARRCASRSGALLIVDETATCLGRTGAAFAVQHSDVVPDIMCLGGALGGGVLPVGAYVATRRINDRVYDKRDPLLHANTTGGNPAACAAALAALDVMEEEGLPARAADAGASLLAELAEMRGRFSDLIEESTGLGLLAGMRLRSAAAAARVQRKAAELGALVGVIGAAAGEAEGEGWISLRPPLLISDAELERGLACLASAFAAVANDKQPEPAVLP